MPTWQAVNTVVEHFGQDTHLRRGDGPGWFRFLGLPVNPPQAWHLHRGQLFVTQAELWITARVHRLGPFPDPGLHCWRQRFAHRQVPAEPIVVGQVDPVHVFGHLPLGFFGIGTDRQAQLLNQRGLLLFGHPELVMAIDHRPVLPGLVVVVMVGQVMNGRDPLADRQQVVTQAPLTFLAHQGEDRSLGKVGPAPHQLTQRSDHHLRHNLGFLGVPLDRQHPLRPRLAQGRGQV